MNPYYSVLGGEIDGMQCAIVGQVAVALGPQGLMVGLLCSIPKSASKKRTSWKDDLRNRRLGRKKGRVKSTRRPGGE